MASFKHVEVDLYIGDQLLESIEELRGAACANFDEFSDKCQGSDILDWLTKIGHSDLADQVKMVPYDESRPMLTAKILGVKIPRNHAKKSDISVLSKSLTTSNHSARKEVVKNGSYREDNELMSVFENASNEDLAILIDSITANGKGRFSLDSDVKEALIKANNATPIAWAAKIVIAGEIQRFGGHTGGNIIRGGKGVLYREIACDVAKHVGANYNDKLDIAQIEGAILLKIVEKSLEKMSEDEKKQFFDQFGVRYEGVTPAAMAALIGVIRISGFAFYKMATIVAQATAKALLGKGLTFAATGGLMKGISVFAGPIGWVITGIWTAFDLAGPAYRVTVPCVIQLAYMRQKALTRECHSCQAAVTKDVKFCGECGHKLA